MSVYCVLKVFGARKRSLLLQYVDVHCMYITNKYDAHRSVVQQHCRFDTTHYSLKILKGNDENQLVVCGRDQQNAKAEVHQVQVNCNHIFFAMQKE